ncbi:DUF1659 domain-containing protein [Peribacillus cavernae]|uniref:DUF1659 domain-containing protein n=1 Tax=Peribacillus cavernae TaxID=1674310 RepID=A0A3S0W8V9_9BACI|nr:DUF1659 domain-containing protein [Peribacillus cavernae]MDQ0217329.1 hypothetical protein [Peribacillus cavernae]RUQ30212.1 DUF1659 domain-containing protein [Peribacillus cavernae]
MANQSLYASTLRVTYETGLNEKGEPQLKRKAFSNVKTSATADQLLQTAQSMANLQQFIVVEIARQDTASIIA